MLQQVEQVLRASLERVITKVATLLPAVLAVFVALVVFCLLGALFAYALRRILQAVRFDERLRTGASSVIPNWAVIRSPSVLLSRIVFWCFAIAGVMVGVAAFAAAYGGSEGLADALVPYVARIVGAALLMLAGIVAARFLERTVLIGSVNMNLHSARLLSQGIKWMVIVLAAAMALDHLGIGGVIVELAFGIFFGGIVLTLALAIGLGSPELVTRTLEQEGVRRTNEPAAQKVHHF